MYALFTGHNYEENGGFDDLHSTSESKDELLNKAIELSTPKPESPWYADAEWWHIVDLDTCEIVERGTE